MARQLWSSSSAADWRAAHASYDAALASLQKDGLVELDEWMQVTLPQTLRTREPSPFVTQVELAKLMRWKLTKGKWRPQLMKFIDGLSDAAVRAASAKAFTELRGESLVSAVQALSELKGVGPATASAVLAAYDNKTPFMGDEALEAIAHVIGARKYTLSHYKAFVEQLEAKAEWLNEQEEAGDQSEGDEVAWSAQRVQLCLYAAAHGGSSPSKVKAKALGKAAAKKRAPASKKGVSDRKDASKSSVDESPAMATRKRRRVGTQ